MKQGFKEDKAIADGPDFNCYSHAAKLCTARMALFLSNRRGRRIALKDVSMPLSYTHNPKGMMGSSSVLASSIWSRESGFTVSKAALAVVKLPRP